MNNLKKIGLSALAGSLVSFSAGAAEMSVSGGAAIYFDDTNRGKATRGNGFYMGDSLNFSASGETDNGISVTVKYEIDAGALDDHSIALGGDWGTLTFDGHGASSAMGAVDDMTPNAYEEAWDVIDVDGTRASGSPLVIGGGGGDNAFIYTSPTVSGAQFKMYYQNDGGAAAVSDSYMDFAISFAPEQVEGLTLGYATRDKDMGVSLDEDADTMYIKYAFGPITVGAQTSESSHTTATLGKESTAYGITYDDLSGGANVRYQGYDASWDGTGSVTTEFADGTVLAHDIDDATGWDSGEQGLKDAISLTDKGTVLQANSSIIDFLQNFD